MAPATAAVREVADTLIIFMVGLLDMENGFDVTIIFDIALGDTRIRMGTYYHSIISTPPPSPPLRGDIGWRMMWLITPDLDRISLT
jgi:hypothetical protein